MMKTARGRTENDSPYDKKVLAAIQNKAELSTFEFAHLAMVAPSTVIKWAEAKTIESRTTPGGHRRISKPTTIKFLQARNLPVPQALKTTPPENKFRTDNNKGPFSTFQLAAMLDIKPNTLIKWANQKKIDTYKTLGGHRRITLEAALLFIKEYNLPVPLALASPRKTNKKRRSRKR